MHNAPHQQPFRQTAPQKSGSSKSLGLWLLIGGIIALVLMCVCVVPVGFVIYSGRAASIDNQVNPDVTRAIESVLCATDTATDVPAGWEVFHHPEGRFSVGLPAGSELSGRTSFVVDRPFIVSISFNERSSQYTVKQVLDATQRGLGRPDRIVLTKDITIREGISCRAVAVKDGDLYNLCRVYVTAEYAYTVSAPCDLDDPEWDNNLAYFFSSFKFDE